MSMLMGNIFLFWGTWQDIKEKKVTGNYLRIGAVVGLLYKIAGIAQKADLVKDWMGALLPGIVLLILAKMTKEKIGYGDGSVIVILGNYWNLKEIWLVLQGALVLTMIVSVILLITKKVGKEYEMPFLPFLWLSHTLLWGLGHV